MRTRHEKLRWYFLVQGILDGLTEEETVRAQFEAWDVQLGIAGKARRLVAADSAEGHRNGGNTTRKRTLTAQRARVEAGEAFQSAVAGPDLWTSGLLTQAAGLVSDEIEWLQGQRKPWPPDDGDKKAGAAERGFAYPCKCVQVTQSSTSAYLGIRRCTTHRLLCDALSFRVVDRFVYWAATRGGRPLPPAPDIPDAWDATVGTELTLRIPARYPIWMARDCLKHFNLRARAALTAAKAAAQLPGRPVEADRAALRRMGRTYFLLELKKPPRPRNVDVGHTYYDTPAKREHSGSNCYCHKEVRYDLKRAGELLAALES